MNVGNGVAAQYDDEFLGERVLKALAAAGLDIEHLDVSELAPIDEFQIGGRQATTELADQLRLQPGDSVLDVGSGIGGPARHLASAYGCRVTGIDLTESFVRLASDLTRRAGLCDRVRFHVGSALALPFARKSFDAATMIHVGMNIEDKARLFADVHKVLKAGGVFGVFDIMQFEAEPLSFPVPWSSKPDTSFVASPVEYRKQLVGAGFAVEKQRVRRDFALDFFREMRARTEAARTSGKTTLSTQIIMGPDFPAKMQNAVEGV